VIAAVAARASCTQNETVRLRVGLAIAAAGVLLAVGVAYGVAALVMLAFFMFVICAVAYALRSGGELVRDASARRFDDDRRR
jgi:cbb3-type cytochrome oxidase subunit 3